MTKDNHLFQSHISICFETKYVEAKTNPKKKDQTRIGCVSSNHVISFANENTLMSIPARTENKNDPLIALKKATHLRVKKSFIVFRFILFIESISSS